MHGFALVSLSSALMAAMLGLSAYPLPSTVPTPPARNGIAAEDFTVHDPLDLVFDDVRLRGKVVTVRTRLACLEDTVCFLDTPLAIDTSIGVRLQGLPTNIKRQLFHRLDAEDCPQLITGYFTGDDLLVTQFSPTVECGTISGPPGPVVFQPVPAGSPAFRFGQSASMNSVNRYRVTEGELDAYTYEKVTTFRQ